MLSTAPLRGIPWFKAAVFALLVCNTTIFIRTGSLSDALDASAWLVLLALFAWETDFGDRFRDARAATAIRAVRLAAAAGVGAAALGYFHEGEWLDAINSSLWIAIVAWLEIQIRFARAVAAHRAWFAGVGATLYAGLGAIVLVWLWHREWFDAYDALLWLTALVIIELNVLRAAGGARTSAT